METLGASSQMASDISNSREIWFWAASYVAGLAVGNALLHESGAPVATLQAGLALAMEGQSRRELALRIAGDDGAAGMEDKLFKAFATSKATGTGVGLSIRSGIVEAHNGRLWFEPNPMGGAIFHVAPPLSDDGVS